eukprot:COSAG02_NODE_252_length_26996_cov_29.825607_11_plen_380_part_00
MLSLFCVLKAGAAHVIAIEASTMAHVCQEMVAAHGIGDRITVVNSRVEDLGAELPGLPPGCDGADAIVSEWMGTVRTESYLKHCMRICCWHLRAVVCPRQGLVGEGMLDSVVRARNMWLKPGGRLLPSTARVFVSGWQHPATAELLRLGLSPAASLLAQRLLEEWRGRPILTSLPSSAVCTDSVCIADLNLCTVECDSDLTELVSERSVELTVRSRASEEAVQRSEEVVWAGSCIWWETGFSADQDHDKLGSVVLTTAPGLAPTHWGQLLLVDDCPPRLLRQGDTVRPMRQSDEQPKAGTLSDLVAAFECAQVHAKASLVALCFGSSGEVRGPKNDTRQYIQAQLLHRFQWQAIFDSRRSQHGLGVIACTNAGQLLMSR